LLNRFFKIFFEIYVGYDFITKQQKLAFLLGDLKASMILKTLLEEYMFSILGTLY
jgi:hypothetical protein